MKNQAALTRRERFENAISNLYEDAFEVLQKKNEDYARDEDPFKNFRMVGLIGLTVDEGIMTRILDKIARLSNVIDGDVAVEEETVDDTILDLINYLAILYAYRKMNGGYGEE